MNFCVYLVSFLFFYILIRHFRKLIRKPKPVLAVGCLRESQCEPVRGKILRLMAFKILITHLAAYLLKKGHLVRIIMEYFHRIEQVLNLCAFLQPMIVMIMMFILKDISVQFVITLDSDLRSMIMNYHEIVTEFAWCRVGLKYVVP